MSTACDSVRAPSRRRTVSDIERTRIGDDATQGNAAVPYSFFSEEIPAYDEPATCVANSGPPGTPCGPPLPPVAPPPAIPPDALGDPEGGEDVDEVVDPTMGEHFTTGSSYGPYGHTGSLCTWKRRVRRSGTGNNLVIAEIISALWPQQAPEIPDVNNLGEPKS